MSDAALPDELSHSPSKDDAAEPERAASAPGGDAERSHGHLVPYLAPDFAYAEQSPFVDESLLHFAPRDHEPEPSTKAGRRFDWRRLRAAASLAAVVAIGAVAAAEHVHALSLARAGQAQTASMAERLDVLSARLESSDLSRSHDELASLRKVLAEIKSGAANTRDVGGAVGQLSARVDHLEKDQSARLDRLAERIDHDASARLSDVTARLDRLEAKAAVAIAPAKPGLAAKTAVAKVAANVSDETTGAIDRPPARLRRFALGGVRNGFAMIYSPAGEFVVAPGDFVPGGGGRVLRFERRGRDWAVVTTEGQIVASEE